jgi:hypothetical protein
MKTTDPFKKTIQAYLEKRASEDLLFAETLKKEKKNINDCVIYILNQVKNSGCSGFADEEIYAMAVHYYDEDIIDVGKPMNSKVVVNHKVEITEEDKAEAKQKAMQILIDESKEEAKKELVSTIKLTPDDIAEAKKIALDEVVKLEREKMTNKKKAPKKVEVKEEVEQDLFSM